MGYSWQSNNEDNEDEAEESGGGEHHVHGPIKVPTTESIADYTRIMSSARDLAKTLFGSETLDKSPGLVFELYAGMVEHANIFATDEDDDCDDCED